MTDAEHAFLDAARDHVWAKVKSMLKKEPTLVDVQPAGRWAALHQAAAFGSIEMCKLLVETYGASLDVLTKNKETPHDVAQDAACKSFLATAEEHAFLDAARERKWDIVTAMLKKNGGLVDCQPAGRWSALHQAASAGSKATCELLIATWCLD